MSKLEYIDPSDWSLHVIDGENECVPEGWILVPDGAESYRSNGKFYKKINQTLLFLSFHGWAKSFDGDAISVLWSRKMKEYLVERDGKYELVKAYHLYGGIEVPENAVALVKQIGVWEGFIDDMKHKGSAKILWQRNPSLNDQYAEIEEVCKIDNVNNPEHYNKGGVECIDAIESSMTKEAFAGYLKGNVQKYMWRYENKGGAESLKKAQWYLNKLVNLVEGGK